MKPKEIEKIHSDKYIRMLKREGVKVDAKRRVICIVNPLHSINTERIKELQYRNQFRVYEQLSMF